MCIKLLFLCPHQIDIGLVPNAIKQHLFDGSTLHVQYHLQCEQQQRETSPRFHPTRSPKSVFPPASTPHALARLLAHPIEPTQLPAQCESISISIKSGLDWRLGRPGRAGLQATGQATGPPSTLPVSEVGEMESQLQCDELKSVFLYSLRVPPVLYKTVLCMCDGAQTNAMRTWTRRVTNQPRIKRA